MTYIIVGAFVGIVVGYWIYIWEQFKKNIDRMNF